MALKPWQPALIKQLTSGDRRALGKAAKSRASENLEARTKTADRVVQSVCPYCAVGCGQKVYVKDEKVVQIEGNPASPISRGRLCPKGSASLGLVIASEWMFGPELETGEVKSVLDDWILPSIDLWAVFPSGRQASAKARAFIDFLEQELTKSGKFHDLARGRAPRRRGQAPGVRRGP